MAYQSLLHFLSLSLPAIPVRGATLSDNTTHAQYPPEIPDVVPWPEFNYAAIIQRYGPLLNETEVDVSLLVRRRVQSEVKGRFKRISVNLFEFVFGALFGLASNT